MLEYTFKNSHIVYGLIQLKTRDFLITEFIKKLRFRKLKPFLDTFPKTSFLPPLRLSTYIKSFEKKLFLSHAGVSNSSRSYLTGYCHCGDL